MQNNLLLSVIRPHCAEVSVIVACNLKQLEGFPVLKIFPDNVEKESTAFPSEGISITSTKKGHLIIALEHREKVMLSGFSHETLDLSSFSEHWKECSITVELSEKI
jgi:hypothetical protein